MGDGKISVRRYFSRGGNPYETTKFRRGSGESAKIVDTKNQRVIYDGTGVEVPESWTDLALRVVGSKYLYQGDNPAQPVERSAKQLVHRVTKTLSRTGEQQGVVGAEDAQIFYDELSAMVFDQKVSFNSPVWFNVGLHGEYGVTEKREGRRSSHWAWRDREVTSDIDAYERPQAPACFIQSISDNMEDILSHARKEGMLFKYGSGTGTDFSPLRGINEPLSGGGSASGMISFLRIYDIIAGRIQSGGKTRRAAKMLSVKDNHPDLIRFIYWKVNEERKALWLSVLPELAPRKPGDLESEAYKTVDGQNGNNSVRLSNAFMEAALKGEDWDLMFITGKRFKEEVEIPLDQYKDDRYLPDKRFIKRLTNKRKTINAGEALETIARAAYVVGDPGLQFDDNINEWNPCLESGRINASNPCSEFMFLDNSACNLASLRLTKFVKEDGSFDIESYREAVRNTIIAQEILVDLSSYPSKEIAENSHRFRPLGLGYTDLGALLMSWGIPYNSDQGRAIASAITSLTTAVAYETSAELARARGPFEEFAKNKESMLRVIGKHLEHAGRIENPVKDLVADKTAADKNLEALLDAGGTTWNRARSLGEQYGYRNAQVTLLAPTGTIGFMMDVDCTGVEPLISLYSDKGLAGGGEIQKNTVPLCVINGLRALGYNGGKLETIVRHVAEKKTIIGAPGLSEEHYGVFATALGDNMISVDGHLRMMAAVQPFLSGAISKTVNLPKGSTLKDIKDTYIKAWKLGLKSISLYVDGSKGVQPINIATANKKKELKWGERDKPASPIERIGYNVDINGTGVHFIVGEYKDRPPKDAPADFFVEFGSSGSLHSATYTSWAKEASRDRQRGEGLPEFVKHNLGARGVISGMTDHPFIKTCSSLEDFFAKLIMLEYFGDTSRCDVRPTPEQIEELRCNVLARRRRAEHFRSRIKFIDTMMNSGKVADIFPLYEDEVERGNIAVSETFCSKCGALLILSGANCKRCPNCGESGGCG
jgi:ribonucleoside-diphosphate reductase alpha chain